MIAHIHESDSDWPIDATNMVPPRDPDDDDEEDENGDDESEDDEPAVIREPDDDQFHTHKMTNSPISRIRPQISPPTACNAMPPEEAIATTHDLLKRCRARSSCFDGAAHA